MVLAAFCVLPLAVLVAPNVLPVGKDYYLPSPAYRLAGNISKEKFSRDGKFLTFFDESVEKSFALERQMIQRGEVGSTRGIVRFDIQLGLKQTLYTPKPEETLMDIVPIGRSGDVICTIAVGGRERTQNAWRAIYFPVGGESRIVADNLETKLFQVAGSQTERKAFILISGLDAKVKYLFITADKTVEKTLPVGGVQGSFFPTYKSGSPVAAIQAAGPDNTLLGNFEFSFITGEATRTSELPDPPQNRSADQLIEFELVSRSKGDSKLGQLPLNDIVAKPAVVEDGKGRLPIAQGVTAIVSWAQTGLAVTYRRDDGYYLREMVKADPSFAKILRGSQ